MCLCFRSYTKDKAASLPASTYVQLKGLQRRPVASRDWRQKAENLPDDAVYVAEPAQLVQAHIWKVGAGRWRFGFARHLLHTAL